MASSEVLPHPQGPAKQINLLDPDWEGGGRKEGAQCSHQEMKCKTKGDAFSDWYLVIFQLLRGQGKQQGQMVGMFFSQSSQIPGFCSPFPHFPLLSLHACFQSLGFRVSGEE